MTRKVTMMVNLGIKELLHHSNHCLNGNKCRMLLLLIQQTHRCLTGLTSWKKLLSDNHVIIDTILNLF